MAFKVIKESILKYNDDIAENIRTLLKEKKILMVNIISSPGAGKTTFLEKVGPMLGRKGIRFAIITGDCFTSRDAERIDALGLEVVQINTGGACHIDAALVKNALEEINISGKDLIIVENVGNLVCPAEFDIGEDMKIAFLSTAEGADKPLKYPLVIKESKLAVVNKVDLLKYVDFDMDFSEKCIRQINPGLEVIKISCKSGEGIERVLEWIKNKIKIKKENVL
ncbi:MAG: hydrogenase nickel incorporation protein HypB [Candidatus Omnitrophica bacterium]|nr:hydrogenase nickel incorporation protein HypB [Candidatus Omnitrophota bacterium]